MEEVKIFASGGMDSDSAIEYIDRPDYLSAFNIRNVGTDKQEGGYITSLEGTVLINFTLPVGLNKCIGVKSFEQLRKAYIFIYNSSGKHTVTEYDFDTNAVTKIFQNLTDTGEVDILPLDPKFYVTDIDYIGEELYFLPSSRVPTKFNIGRLKSSYYGVVQAQDIAVIKAKPDSVITYTYYDDPSRTSNLVENNLIKLSSQYIYNNKEESVFSELSKVYIPTSSQTTISSGGKNNALLVSINIGDDRVDTIVVGAVFNNNLQWKEIKRIKRSEAILAATAVNPATGILDAYSGGVYSFLFYNDGLYTAIDELTTDIEYDRVPKEAQAQANLNGNVLNYSNITEGFDPVTIDITGDVSYRKLVAVDVATESNYLRVTSYDISKTFGGFLSNKTYFYLNVYYEGIVKQNDVLDIQIRSKSSGTITQLNSTVPAAFNNNTLGALNNYVATQPFPSGGNVYDLGGGKYQLKALISTTTDNKSTPPFDVIVADVIVFSRAIGEFKAVKALKLNSSRQYGIMYEDAYGRLGGVLTNDFLIFKSNSYGVTLGNSPVVTLNITHTPPTWATSYHIVTTGQLTHNNVVYMVGKLIVPTNYATGTYQKGSFVIYNADIYRSLVNNNTVVPASDAAKWSILGSLDDFLNDTYLPFDVTSLKKFGDVNDSSVISYDFTKGDRANLCYFTDGAGVDQYYNTNPKDVIVSGFEVDAIGQDREDPSAGFILKIQKADINEAEIVGKDLLFEIYTPKKAVDESNLFYSMGERYSITNGVHDQTKIEINGGECFIKTRQYYRPTDINVAKTYIVEDFNYNDFAENTNVTDLGRPYLYNKEDKERTLPAHMRYSDVFNASTGINLLNRFFAENIYGNEAGQSTDVHGGIKKAVQRGSRLILFQELEIGYIPVNATIYEDATGQENVAVSTKLLNNIRYSGNGVGIGNAPESFAERDGVHYFVDPNKSEPYLEAGGNIVSIAGKMSKFFRDNLQSVYTTGRKIIGRYNNFYNEYELTIEAESGVITQTTFSTGNFAGDAYVVNAADITVTQPINGTVVYNNTTGIATYTPDNDITGSDPFTFTFQEIPRNVCLTVLVGDKIPNAFFFLDVTGQPISTLIESNAILVDGMNIPSAISITGGEYEKNNSGVWTSVAGTVINGDSVKVRQTSSATNEVTTNTVLTIGGISDTFSVTTIEAVSPTSTLTFASYGSGIFYFTLSNPLPTSNLTITGVSVQGSNDGCVSPIETDSSATATITFGNTTANANGATPLTAASTSYSKNNAMTVNGTAYIDGNTFIIDGITVSISVPAGCTTII